MVNKLFTPGGNRNKGLQFPLQCLPPLPDQTGSQLPPGGLAYPHNTLLDPVGFQGSRFPSSLHLFTTGTSPIMVSEPAEERSLRCAPSTLFLTTEGALHPGSQRSEERILTNGQGGPSHDLHAAVLPLDGNLPRGCQPQPRPSPRNVLQRVQDWRPISNSPVTQRITKFCREKVLQVSTTASRVSLETFII